MSGILRGGGKRSQQLAAHCGMTWSFAAGEVIPKGKLTRIRGDYVVLPTRDSVNRTGKLAEWEAGTAQI